VLAANVDELRQAERVGSHNTLILLFPRVCTAINRGIKYQLRVDLLTASRAGMRGNLIHGYDLIDWDEVWTTSTVDVPDLLAKVESYSNK